MIKTILRYVNYLRLPYQKKEYIDKMRLIKLKKLIYHAKTNVPFYRKKYSNVDLSKIEHVEDIRRLPVITSMELREEKIEDITAEDVDPGDPAGKQVSRHCGAERAGPTGDGDN